MFNVFVYGTLKSGEGNHGCLSHGCSEPQNATVVGSLYNLGLYPALKVPTEYIMATGSEFLDRDHEIQGLVSPRDMQGDVVYGEFYTLYNYDALERLDYLEGHPNFYRRVLVPTLVEGKSQVAWTYVINHLDEEKKRIKSGRWG